jgi:two-component system sensor histidine kinase ChiS
MTPIKGAAAADEPGRGDGSDKRGSASDHAVTDKFPASRRVRPRTIVVVDDSDDAQEFFTSSLEGAGYVVLAARNGKEALDILVDHATPSAIIVDLFMPVMDGYELVDILRSYTRLAQVPMLVVSAADGQIAFPAGPETCFLKKPIEELELLQTLERIIHAASGRR